MHEYIGSSKLWGHNYCDMRKNSYATATSMRHKSMVLLNDLDIFIYRCPLRTMYTSLTTNIILYIPGFNKMGKFAAPFVIGSIIVSILICHCKSCLDISHYYIKYQSDTHLGKFLCREPGIPQ